MIVDQDGNELQVPERKPTAVDWFLLFAWLSLAALTFAWFFTEFLPGILG